MQKLCKVVTLSLSFSLSLYFSLTSCLYLVLSALVFSIVLDHFDCELALYNVIVCTCTYLMLQ